MACAARVGTDTDARIRSAMRGILMRFLRTCTGRPIAYKPWGRSCGAKEYCEKRQQLLLTLGGPMLDQKASPNFDPCAMARNVCVKERMSEDSQFGLVQIAMDLVFHPCDAERMRFHCVAPLYRTTAEGGLPASLNSLTAIGQASSKIFNHSTMKRSLHVLHLPILRDSTVRWLIVEHGGCGWRKYTEAAACIHDGTVRQWVQEAMYNGFRTIVKPRHVEPIWHGRLLEA